MMTNLQAQAHQNMVTLAQQHMDALKEIVHSNTRGGSSGMTDTRGIGRPVVFKGEEQRYGEWKAKLFAFLRVSTPQAMEWISWAGSQASTIDEELIAEDCQSENQRSSSAAPRKTLSTSVTVWQRATGSRQCAC